MTAEYDDILDGLFHGCALAAYLDQAAEERGWPSSEGTRRRAFAYYEQALRERNVAKPPRPTPPAASASSPSPRSA
jgi:hypothetical protein